MMISNQPNQPREERISLLVKEAVMDKVDATREVSEEEIRALIRDTLHEIGPQYMLSASERARIAEHVFNRMKRLDIIQDLLEDDTITEIMVNNSHSPVFIERDGILSATDRVFESDERLVNVAQRIVARANKIVNESTPIVDTRLPDGSRVNIVLAPTLIGGGAAITIRKFYRNPLSMQRMIELGSLTQEAADFLQKLVIARYNIFISGANRIIGLSQMTFRKQRVQTT